MILHKLADLVLKKQYYFDYRQCSKRHYSHFFVNVSAFPFQKGYVNQPSLH